MNKMALIYIVEDDENIREIETIALKNSNYMVCAFEKAKDFYRKLEDIMPDLVLLDVMLPDESGYDIVRKLRKDPTTRQLPIIMVTAKTAEMDMITSRDNTTFWLVIRRRSNSYSLNVSSTCLLSTNTI